MHCLHHYHAAQSMSKNDQYDTWIPTQAGFLFQYVASMSPLIQYGTCETHYVQTSSRRHTDLSSQFQLRLVVGVVPRNPDVSATKGAQTFPSIC
jgi:hypothetical protein